MESETYYKPIKAICEDGRIRTVHVKCYRYDGSYAADTYFTIPAYTHAKGKTIRGYVSDPHYFGLPGPFDLMFSAYRYRKNWNVIDETIHNAFIDTDEYYGLAEGQAV